MRTRRHLLRTSGRVLPLVGVVSLLLPGSAAADPAPTPNPMCSIILGPATCAGGRVIGQGTKRLAEQAKDTFKGFTPQGIVEEWATSAARSSAEVLAKAQQNMILAGTPDFTASWWITRYAVTFGVGIVVLALTLTIVSGRLASSGGVEGTQLAKQTGLSAPLYVPLMALAPALLDIVVQMIYQLAGWFGQQSTADIGTAVESYVRVLNRLHDPNAMTGGALFLLVVAGVVFLAALLAVVETTVASFGAQLIMLLLPIVAALAIYPPARQRLWRLAGVLLGLLLTPVMLFLAWWVVWGAAAALFTSQPNQGTPWSTLLFVAVGSVVAISAPAVLGMIGPAVGASLTNSAGSRLRGNATSAARGAQSGARTISRMSASRSSSAAAGGTKAAAGVAAGAAAAAGGAVYKGAKRTQSSARQTGARTQEESSQQQSSSSPSSSTPDRSSSAPQGSSSESGTSPTTSAAPPHEAPPRGSGPPAHDRRGDQSPDLSVHNGTAQQSSPTTSNTRPGSTPPTRREGEQ